VVAVALATQTTELLSSGGETTKLTVLVHRLAEPVDSWVVADSTVSNINKDDLKVLVGRVLQYKKCASRELVNIKLKNSQPFSHIIAIDQYIPHSPSRS
jgi:hypothetical protein